MTQQMTITVPSDNSNELAYFILEFDCPLEEFIENIELLVKSNDVVLGEEMGMWAIK